MSGAQAAMLPDGRRLHLNQGPIDLIVEAFGEPNEVSAAYAQAKDRFDTVLEELVSELAELRQPTTVAPRGFRGATARRMETAALPFSDRFVTPMAAVAGAVADEMLAAMVKGRRLARAYVNDGGDIAMHLAPGTAMKAAIAGTRHGVVDRVTIAASDPVRGIATSGWRGRSHSLGIADAVTVLARTAAAADVAATLIANAVDLPGHPAIERQPASQLAPDSDLGDRPVTVAVGRLSSADTDEALRGGVRVADEFVAAGLIVSAALFLNGRSRVVAALALEQNTSIEEPAYG
ncbi:UPF0280 family protein [Neoaquamicrobium sediminum]|uniref:UPF0280 family protein n=1 Tax=Neoaquamicrobium sediminum TaxID=1849104 RepID=UPI0015673D14|nr:UPF0280 family protein [Mesorhizobium sediminum]NRC56861.1 UPF0280 family protein [Mesorhizobium sediminum]